MNKIKVFDTRNEEEETINDFLKGKVIKNILTTAADYHHYVTIWYKTKGGKDDTKR